MKKSLLLIVFAALLISACSDGVPKGIEVAEVVFAKELSENFKPVGSTKEFYPDETINVSVRIPGRPKEGILAARFLYMDDLIAETSIDFGQENSDLLFSVGQDTFTGFFLTHDDPLYISPLYNVELLVDGKSIGMYPYAVIPPMDAIPTVLRSTTFAAGVTDAVDPVDEKDVFSSAEVVHIIGDGDFGRMSYIQADWFLSSGEQITDCTVGITVEENLPHDRFYFSSELDAGWPAGEHKLVLTIDDEKVAEETFTIQ